MPASALIPYASSTPVAFSFQEIRSLNAQIRYFDAGGNDLGPGVGVATLVATNRSFEVTGAGITPFWSAWIISDIEEGTLTGAIGGRWYELDLGDGMSQVTITATSTGAPPPGATQYRIIIDVNEVEP